MTLPPRASYSLHRRLTSTLLLATTAVWLVVAAVGYFLAHHEADELFDDQLSEFGNNLLQVAAAAEDEELPRTQRQPRSHSHAAKHSTHYTVWHQESATAPWQVVLTSSEPAPAPPSWSARPELADQVWQGKRWRSYTASDAEHALYVRVLENHAAREELAGEYALRLLVPLLLGLPLLAGLILVLINRALRPMDRLTAAIAQRAADDASPVATPDAVPVELATMLGALDQLFDRVGAAIDRERRFTADAGHELRTPLAAIRLHAQIAYTALQRDHYGSGETAQAVQAVSEVITATDRATHLAEQLLLLARLSPERQPQQERCDLVLAVRQACADLASGPQRHPLIYEGVEAAEIVGNPALLYTLTRNLVDNAIRYTPPDSPILVTVTPTADGAWQLAISDDGPGIPAALRQQACQRFARLNRRSGDGCGLGLSIVARIAELHTAQLTLADHHPGATPPGLTVQLHFPPPPSASHP